MRLPCADGCEGRETPYNVYTIEVIFVHSRGWAPAPRQQEGEPWIKRLPQRSSYSTLVRSTVNSLPVASATSTCIPKLSPATSRPYEMREMNASALILSGGPASVYAEDAPSIDPAIFDLGLPRPGLLLRPSDHGRDAGRQGRSLRGGRIRPCRLLRVLPAPSSLTPRPWSKPCG